MQKRPLRDQIFRHDGDSEQQSGTERYGYKEAFNGGSQDYTHHRPKRHSLLSDLANNLAFKGLLDSTSEEALTNLLATTSRSQDQFSSTVLIFN